MIVYICEREGESAQQVMKVTHSRDYSIVRRTAPVLFSVGSLLLMIMMERQEKWYYKLGEILHFSFIVEVNRFTVLDNYSVTVQGFSSPVN